MGVDILLAHRKSVAGIGGMALAVINNRIRLRGQHGKHVCGVWYQASKNVLDWPQTKDNDARSKKLIHFTPCGHCGRPGDPAREAKMIVRKQKVRASSLSYL